MIPVTRRSGRRTTRILGNPLVPGSAARLWLVIASVAAVFAIAGHSVAADDPAATAKQILASVTAQEGVASSGKLTVVVSDRRGPYKLGETQSETAKRLEAEEAAVADGTITFGPSGWIKDLRLPVSRFNPSPVRSRTAETNGVLRTLLEDRADNRDRKQARVIAVPASAPADALLSRRLARAADGLTWTAAKTDGALVTLSASRGGSEKHTLVFATGTVTALESWKLVRQRATPDGESYSQTYSCRVSAGIEPGSIARVEEWVINTPPIGNVSLRVTEIRKSEPAPDLKPDQLSLRFPVGTQVVDARGEVPVEYEQTAEGINDEDIRQTANEFAKDRIRPGQSVPDMAFEGVKGKDVALKELRGKVVLLFWFSSDSRPAQAASLGLEELYSVYKSKGVQVVGLDVGDGPGSPDKADVYRKKYKWTFPVAVDWEGAAVRAFGLVPAVPKIAIIDRDGKLVYVQAGVDPKTIVSTLDGLTRK